MASFKDTSPKGFRTPTALPQTPDESQRWQEANKAWWEQHPMRYDWKKSIKHPEFTADFYKEIDRRFFSEVKQYMPWKRLPFDPLIHFDALADKDVLEIGVGNGSHAQLLAQAARSFTGIDLTPHAVESTSKRLSCFGLQGAVSQMDAERMEFPDHTFDFIWSWGVIHHSSNTRNILREMKRVLRPGGEAVTMVYHRNLWNYYFVGGLLHGILQGNLIRTKSVHKTIQGWTDGALARFYTASEWEKLCSEFFSVDEICIFGNKSDLLLFPAGKLKALASACLADGMSRFFTNRCRLGSFLVSKLRN